MIRDCKNEERKEKRKKEKKHARNKFKSEREKEILVRFSSDSMSEATTSIPIKRPPRTFNYLFALSGPMRVRSNEPASKSSNFHPLPPVLSLFDPPPNLPSLLPAGERERERGMVNEKTWKQRPRTIINTLSKNFNFGNVGEIKFLQYPRDK